MKNNLEFLFFRKIIYSCIFQIVIMMSLIYIMKIEFDKLKIDNIVHDLSIKDRFTIEKIEKNVILKNRKALELELNNIGEIKKLDFIEFNEKEAYRNIGEIIFKDKNFKVFKDHHHYTGLLTLKFKEETIGYILMEKSYGENSIFSYHYSLIFIIISVFIVFLFNFIFVFSSLKSSFKNNTNSLLNIVFREKEDDLENINIYEYRIFAEKFLFWKKSFMDLSKEKIYIDTLKKIAEQVSHDIQSPLAAISVIISTLDAISDERRKIIFKAFERIKEISSELVFKNYTNLASINYNHNYPIILSIKEILTEKSQEITDSKISIELKNDTQSLIFCKIDENKFKRLLSNIINNSIEAIRVKGYIKVEVYEDREKLFISIIDNGIGINEENLKKITDYKFSHGKANGTGIGLFYARQVIEDCGGKIRISSKLGLGTQVLLSIPKIEIPEHINVHSTITENSTFFIYSKNENMKKEFYEEFNKINKFKMDVRLIEKQEIKNKEIDFYFIDFDVIAEGKEINLKNEYFDKERVVIMMDKNKLSKIDLSTFEYKFKIITMDFLPFLKIKSISKDFLLSY